MRVLGFDISRSWPSIRATGTSAFEQIRDLAAIKAANPELPIQRPDWNFGAEVAPTIAKSPYLLTPANDSNYERRVVGADPREAYYLALPNKLTPQQCLNIMRAGLGGDIWQMGMLLALMEDTWPTFRMASHQLREAVSHMRFNVQAVAAKGKDPTPEAEERAELVDRAMKSFTPNPFNDEKNFSGFVYNCCHAMLLGISMDEIVWYRKASETNGLPEVLPRAAMWVHPRHFTFTDQGFITVLADDYSRLYTDPRLIQRIRLGESPDPDRFVCSQFISRSGSVLGAGFMRPLVWYWAARQFNLEWMLNTAKQYGSPFIAIGYKQGQNGRGDVDELNAFLKDAGALRRLLHPEGTTPQIFPAGTLGKENPQRVIEEKADEACLFLLLGQKGTTFGTAGKLGSDDTHADVKDERKHGLAKWVADNSLTQFARMVLRMNYGNDDFCPTIEPDTTKPLNAQDTATLTSSISTSRVPVVADEFYKKIGFSRPEPGDTVIAGGVIGVQGEALTQEEQFEQELGQQEMQAEVQMGLENQMAPAPAKGAQPVKINVVRAQARRAAAAMTDAELSLAEEAVKAATVAVKSGHVNGEWDEVRGILAKRGVTL